MFSRKVSSWVVPEWSFLELRIAFGKTETQASIEPVTTGRSIPPSPMSTSAGKVKQQAKIPYS